MNENVPKTTNMDATSVSLRVVIKLSRYLEP